MDSGLKGDIMEKNLCVTEQMTEKSGETSQPPESGSRTSDTSVVEEVRQAIRAELTNNLKNLGLGPSLYHSHILPV